MSRFSLTGFFCALSLCASLSACGGDGGDTGPVVEPECEADADCDDGNACTDDVCAEGMCDNPDNTAACDDGDPCTVGDACSSGSCQPGGPKDCSDLDGACEAGQCNAESGECEAMPANEGGDCDDGNRCTVRDVCTAGDCRGETKDCSAFGNDCNDGVCNQASGACQAQPANNGDSCSDGDACTEDDVCNSGQCRGVAKDCSGLDGTCTVGRCDDGSGECVEAPANEGGGCDDDDMCTDGDTCVNGACRGEERDCSGLDGVCTAGACDSGTGECVAAPANEGGGCDDDDMCTLDDVCVDGECVGADVDCTGFDGPCALGVCVSETGDCAAQPMDEGEPCDDDNPCTGEGSCNAGVCEVVDTFTLFGGSEDPEDAGWSVDRNGTPSESLVGEAWQIDTTGGVDASSVYHLDVDTYEGQGVTVRWSVLVVESAPALEARNAASALFGSYTPGGPTEAELNQMVMFNDSTVAWGDLSETYSLDTTAAFHDFELVIGADGVATLMVDGEVALTRTGAEYGGAVAFGDPSSTNDINSIIQVDGVERVCQ